MLQQERFEKILYRLQIEKAVKVKELAKKLNISESTVRRDINELDAMGRLKKVFGGAVSAQGSISANEANVAAKAALNIEEKIAIAKYAVTVINDNDFVYIDAGTTTEKMIDYITNQNATYVTNGINHARRLAQRGLKTFVLGGELKRSTEAMIGVEAVNSIKKYNFTKCFMGTNGIDAEKGFTTPDIDEAMIKAEAMKRSYVAYVLADSSKFGQITPVHFADIETACIITDKIADPAYSKYTIVKEV